MVVKPLNCKIITCGASETGKTSFLEILINNNTLSSETSQLSIKQQSSNSSSSNKETSRLAIKTQNQSVVSNSSTEQKPPSISNNKNSAIQINSANSNSNSSNHSNSNLPNNINNSTLKDQDMMFPSSTKEDIYLCTVNSERGPAVVRIHDTPGNNWTSKASPPRHYCHFGDGFLLFFDLTNLDSFKYIEYIKSEILKERENKDIHLVLIGMKKDAVEKISDSQIVPDSSIQAFLEKEKISSAAYFECSVKDRSSLSKPIQYIIQKMTAPVPKTGLLSRRLGRE